MYFLSITVKMKTNLIHYRNVQVVSVKLSLPYQPPIPFL